MAQRYKLRLGDGTFLSVDLDGLRAWAEDGRAMVQAIGSQRWRPLQEVLAEEESAARLARALVPPQPRHESTPAPPAPSPAVEPPAFSEPPAPVTPRPSLQVLADDPGAARPGAAPTVSGSADEVPAIRMKPLDDEPRYQSVWSGEREEDAGDLDEDELRDGRLEGPLLDGPLLTALETLGGLLSRLLTPLTPLVRGVGRKSPGEPLPRRAAIAPRSAPSDAESEPIAKRALTVLAGVSAKVADGFRGLVARVGRAEATGGAEDVERPQPPVPKREAARPAPEPFPAPKPVAPPPPLSALPALRFREVEEPREEVDLFEGEYEYEGGPIESLLQPVWRWTKRLVVIGGLVAGGLYAASSWDTWFPKAADLGQAVFTEIDRQAQSRERAERERQALADAITRLPHLAPETIRLVYAGSPTGVFDPPDVFEIAFAAAERGKAALTPAEAEELQDLQRELLETLRPPQRERIREYERARERRAIFPFENPHVLELVARGARALPAPRLERLQALNAKAVASGLALPEDTAAAQQAAR